MSVNQRGLSRHQDAQERRHCSNVDGASLEDPPSLCVTMTRMEKSVKSLVSRRMLTTCAMPPAVVQIMTGDFKGTHRSVES